MIAVYIRTSTNDQTGKAQEHAIQRQLAARDIRDWAPFVDVGHSGAKTSRPEFDRLRAEIRQGRIKQLYIYALDRLGRSLVAVLDVLIEAHNAGCQIVSLREGLDLTTATGRLQAQLFAAFAEFEREIIRERVQAGINAARGRGVTLGRPTRKLASDTVERMAAARNAGASWSEVARRFGVSRATAKRILQTA